MTAPSILKPLRFPNRQVQARNRVLLPAMTNRQSHEDGKLGDDELRWLLSRARGGYGIVTTCAAHVSPEAKGFDGQLGIFDDTLLPGLRRLAGALNGEGALALVQIYHGGVRSPSRLTGRRPISASEFDPSGQDPERPSEATDDQIKATIEDFVRAALRAQEAGFGGVEIHGAHGYLLTQFLGTVSNSRNDHWGGQLEGRARILREIVRQCRAACSPDFLVGARISPEVANLGVDFDESLQVAQWLVADGCDFIHVSNWDSFKSPEKYSESSKPITQWFREALGPDPIVFATGGVWTQEQAEMVMQQGADVVGLGRAGICNPTWPIDALDASWQPDRPPLSPELLGARGLGPDFINYMRRWPNFVSDES